MNDFNIKNFNSNVQEDTEFFRVLTEKANTLIPVLRPVLNPETDDYQLFIALVQRLAYSCSALENKANIISRWIPSCYVAKDNLSLTIAVKIIMYGEVEAFFEAGNLDDYVRSGLIDLIIDVFKTVYVSNSQTTNLFGE